MDEHSNIIPKSDDEKILSLSARRNNPNEPIIMKEVPDLPPEGEDDMVEVSKLRYAEAVFVLNQHKDKIASCFEKVATPPRRTYICPSHHEQTQPPWFTCFTPEHRGQERKWMVHKALLAAMDEIGDIA